MADAALILARWFYFAAVMVLFGSSLFPFYALDRTTKAMRARLPALVNVGLALMALISTLVWLLSFAVDLGGPENIAGTLQGVLLESSLGGIWIVRLSVVTALLIVSASRQPALILGPSFLLLVCEGWSGHAAAWGFWASLVQAIHVACAGAWIGGLLPLARVIATARQHRSGIVIAGAAIRRFSRVGIVVVGVIALTGAANTWRVLGTLPDPADSYGQVLLLKIGLFASMIGIAAFNRYYLIVKLERPDPTSTLEALSRNIALEQIFGAGVLLAVSVLGLMSPRE